LILFKLIGKDQIVREKTIGAIYTDWEGLDCEEKDHWYFSLSSGIVMFRPGFKPQAKAQVTA
jgi:hypothetical protein